MGNCLIGGLGDDRQLTIRVTTSNGGVMEFHGPITVESITDEFPSHGIFRSHDLFWNPLPHSQFLVAGESYHLLPLSDADSKTPVRSNSAPPRQRSANYRMSFAKRLPDEEVIGKGFWKDERAEELIESVRTVAKCGGGGLSDKWSLSSSRNAASSTNKDSIFLEF
ncbi:hypothetical protein CASFOL_023061 [Castilleja foliolosa]|uniref:Uncharacterized protein n=1 Tax=Castilleja foliolosa TaxID=1961234 RepID=A0ABD3CNA8_9LAMI